MVINIKYFLKPRNHVLLTTGGGNEKQEDHLRSSQLASLIPLINVILQKLPFIFNSLSFLYFIKPTI